MVRSDGNIAKSTLGASSTLEMSSTITPSKISVLDDSKGEEGEVAVKRTMTSF
jgi:hypothetical protein